MMKLSEVEKMDHYDFFQWWTRELGSSPRGDMTKLLIDLQLIEVDCEHNYYRTPQSKVRKSDKSISIKERVAEVLAIIW